MLSNIGLPGLIILSPFIFALVMGVYSLIRVPNFDENYRFAGFWLRFFAVLIDAIILNVVSFLPFYMLGYFIGLSMVGSAPMHEIEATANAVGTLLGFIVGWLYYAVMESSKRQATFGKMALGIRVVDLNGNRISFGKATGRHFGKILSLITFFIGHFMAGWTRKKQALHDKMSGCLVVKNHSPIFQSSREPASNLMPTTNHKSTSEKILIQPTLSKSKSGVIDAFDAEALRRYKAGEIDEETMLKLLGRDSI
jgi:uncharacterized RDD family membrane protein YckC